MNTLPRILLAIATTMAAIALAHPASVQATALINEIRIDQPSSDNDEYFELVAAAQQDLSGLTYVVIGDGNGGSGVIEAVISLNGQSTDSNGFFVAAESSFSIGTANLANANLNFENSDNVTHLLVSGFSGSSGDDLDTNDDGELDSTPWVEIVDSIALIETPDSGDGFYSDNRVGPNGSNVPAQVYRCGSRFEIGGFATNTNDTPGAINTDCRAYINELRIDQPGQADDDEYAEVAGAAFSNLDGISLVLIGDGDAGSGVIDEVVSFSATDTINSNGLFTVAQSSFGLASADLTQSLNFENGDNITFLLVSGLTGSVGDDLDTDDDGTLDITPWVEVLDSVALLQSVGSGDLVYSSTQVGPNGDFVPAHAYLCPDMWRIGEFSPSDPDAVDTPASPNTCSNDNGGGVITLTIPEIQGSDLTSPFDGQTVVTTGVVVGDYQTDDQLRGFFMQDPTGDDNAATSDGIFVFDPNGTGVSVGDNVTVTGRVSAFRGNTQLSSITDITINSTNNSINPTRISLPESIDGELEKYEGMLIEIDQTMTVSQTFFLARYGQLTLSSANDNGEQGRLFNPTNQFPAGSSAALELANENARRTLFLDDGQDISSQGDNPDPTPYLNGPPATPIRSGDTINNLIGVLDEGQVSGSSNTTDYRLHPTTPPVFIASNPRTPSPANAHAGLTIASFNVLNYFNTIDTGASICGPNGGERCRGADSTAEFTRQRDKIIDALVAIDADIVGLIELENNGLGDGSAIQDLVNGVNAAIGRAEYAVLNVNQGLTPGIGGDAIAVGFIYKPAAATSVGTPAVLTTGAFSETLPSGRNRQPIAASFRDTVDGEIITIAVNHFKSKGSPPNPPLGNGNDDQGDGQGSWNLRRTEAATDLSDWLASNPTGVQDSDVLIIGDINAYAQEDPILAFASKGYNNLVKQFEGETSYSFTFNGTAGSLDHALASDSLTQKVANVETWHINTDESTIFDYNLEFKANTQNAPDGYYSPSPYRSSDHDPIIITLKRDSETCYVIKIKSENTVIFCL